MTGFSLGPPAADGPEFAAFVELHGIRPRTAEEVAYWRLVLWFLKLGGDPARIAVAVAAHQVAREAAAFIERARRGAG